MASKTRKSKGINIRITIVCGGQHVYMLSLYGHIDGRLVDKPTYIVIKKLLDSIKTITKFDSLGNEVRRFAYDTDMRRLDLVIKMGFDPIIYIEKFTLKMDLWEYKS